MKVIIKRNNKGRKKLWICLSLFFGILVGGGVTALVFLLTQCSSKSSKSASLPNLINDKIRYQFTDEPTDADLYGELNRVNHYNFEVGALNFERNVPFQSITISSFDEKKYSGEVTIHYDVSPYISLSTWVIEDDEYLSVVDLGTFAEPVSSSGDDCYTRLMQLFYDEHSDDEWNSFIRNTGFTNIGGTYYKFGYLTGLPFEQQSTTTPFIGSLLLYWIDS